MNIVLGIALFFVLWWMILFAVLPFGVRSQYETGEVVPGTEGAAPARPHLLRKALATTVLTVLVWGVIYAFISGHVISLDAIPIGPNKLRV